MVTRYEILSTGLGGKAEEDYAFTCQDGHQIVIPLYFPERELAIFLKENLKSLDPSVSMPLVKMGLKVANVSSVGEFMACLEWKDLTGQVETYVPVEMPKIVRSAKSAMPTDQEIRQSAQPTQQPAVDAYYRPGPNGFSPADRDRAERDLERIRARLERELGRDLAGCSVSEILSLANAQSLRRSYENQPDIDGDFRKSEVTDV